MTAGTVGTISPGFAVVVAGMDMRPVCEVSSGEGADRCGRPSRWWVVCHDCGTGMACHEHLRKFLGQALAGDPVFCNGCRRQFPSISDAVQVVAL